MNIKKENQILRPMLNWNTMVLYAIIFIPSLFSADIYSPFLVLIGFILLTKSHGKLKLSYLSFVTPLLIIFLLGIIAISGHEAKHIFRDISYALTPISLIFVGFWLAEHKIIWPRILKILVTGGTIIAIIHLSNLLQMSAFMSAGMYDLRREAQNPNIGLIALSLVLGIFQNHLKIPNLFPKWLPRFIAIPLLIVSFIFSFSRIGLLFGLMLTVSFLGFIGKLNLRTILTIIILVGSFFVIVLTTPSDEVGTFRSQIARSLTEVAVSNSESLSDINKNWRGFETYRAVTTFASGNIKEQIFGHGFGSLIDLGLTMTLNGINFSQIPILHNGYAYVLVKFGIAGILCYLFYYFILIKLSLKYSISENKELNLLSKIMLGCTLCLMLSMFVVGGMAEIHDSEFVLLTGYIFRRIEQI